MWKKCQAIIGTSNIPQGMWTTRLTASSGQSLGHIPIPCGCILHFKSLIWLGVGKDTGSLVLFELCGLVGEDGVVGRTTRRPSSRPSDCCCFFNHFLSNILILLSFLRQGNSAGSCTNKMFQGEIEPLLQPLQLWVMWTQPAAEMALSWLSRNIQRLHRCLPERQRCNTGRRPAVKGQMDGKVNKKRVFWRKVSQLLEISFQSQTRWQETTGCYFLILNHSCCVHAAIHIH